MSDAPSPVPAICERGNPGMAAAGMGDVLTGAHRRHPGAMPRPVAGGARRGDGACVGRAMSWRRDRERGILALELAEALNRWVNLRR